MFQWKPLITLIMLTYGGRGRPNLDMPAGWTSSWDGSDYTYRRQSDGYSTDVHPAILAVWVTTAHWHPTINALSAAEGWLNSSPEDYAWAAAVATFTEQANFRIFHGQPAVWLRPPPFFPPEVIAQILEVVATQTEARRPGRSRST